MNIGTRGSKLAKIQTDIAVKKLGIKGDVKIIKTHGDSSRKELKSMGGRAFTRELDEALLRREIDIAVHSLKDIPVEGFPEELEIACVVERGDPRDCLVSNRGDLTELPEDAVVGASSERRKAEILRLRGGLKIKPLRGNVLTRMEKLDRGEYDAIITAKCALDRLGISERANRVFRISEMLPAAGQGAIAVVKRKDVEFDVPDELKPNLTPCMLERLFITDLGACRKPVGAYCSSTKKGVYALVGLYYSGGLRLAPEFKGSPEEIKQAVQAWKKKIL